MNAQKTLWLAGFGIAVTIVASGVLARAQDIPAPPRSEDGFVPMHRAVVVEQLKFVWTPTKPSLWRIEGRSADALGPGTDHFDIERFRRQTDVPPSQRMPRSGFSLTRFAESAGIRKSACPFSAWEMHLWLQQNLESSGLTPLTLPGIPIPWSGSRVPRNRP